MSVSRKASVLVAGAAGLVATAATVTAVAVRATKRRHRDDLYADEPFGRLAPDRGSTVVAGDGVVLSVEEVDPAGGGEPELTVVYVHGFALSRRCWHFQRRDVAKLSRPRVRQVLYDQRGHGRSGPAGAVSCTIDQLGSDLVEVLRATVPDGPIVLVGHSMGGMAIMAAAELEPKLFADRIRGVVLISTAAGEIGAGGLRRSLLSRYNPVTKGVGRLAEWRPGLVELVRAAGGKITQQGVRLLGFGGWDTSMSLVDFVVEMLDVTPVPVLAGFVDTLGTHNRYAALAGLKHAHVVVISGDADRVTPFSHAERIVAELPDAELVRVPGGGHLPMLGRPDLVYDHLVMLLQRSAYGSRTRRRTRWRPA
jgi:pimeloyl-ACP methyl ester carboxylesterase